MGAAPNPRAGRRGRGQEIVATQNENARRSAIRSKRLVRPFPKAVQWDQCSREGDEAPSEERLDGRHLLAKSEMSEKAVDPLVVALPDATYPNATEARRNEIPTVLSPTHLVDDCWIGRFSPRFSDL